MKSESERGVFFIFAARERQDTTRSLSTHGFPCCIFKRLKLGSPYWLLIFQVNAPVGFTRTNGIDMLVI